jgi:ribosomal protein L11 methyltransferase
MAFGSGRHETTQLCLEALEKFLQPGQVVYDIGCGSGILSLAAMRLGATVIASDIDESALSIARRHFSGPLFVGSADCFPEHSADVVLSNITGAVNDHIAADLKRIAKPGGVIVVSGFTGQTAPLSFRPTHTLSLNDWQCWLCDPANITPAPETADPNHHEPQWWL